MQDYMIKRVLQVAEYILESGATVRDAARVFSISKSTVHKDITERLSIIAPAMAQEVQKVLQHNKEERHIRGGLATKKMHAQRKRA